MDLEILKIKFFLHLQILLQNNKKGVINKTDGHDITEIL
jgi:hypothetical protein